MSSIFSGHFLGDFWGHFLGHFSQTTDIALMWDKLWISIILFDWLSESKKTLDRTARVIISERFEPFRLLTSLLMATIRQIARDLKVSVSTVSAVINNSSYVSAALRTRIEKALHEADYRPNQIARSLRLRETRTIGLIVPDLANSFYSQLMRGAEDYLVGASYRLLVADSREDWKRQHDYLMAFSGKATDGIILVPCMASSDQLNSIPRLVRGTPLVYVDRSPVNCAVDSVLVDNVRASHEATRHLLELGHRRIGIITEPLNLLNSAERLVGYEQALESFRVRVDRKLIRSGDNTQDSGYWRGLELLRLVGPPTAIFVCNNLMTLGVLVALRELGVVCPRELSVVGFDDFEWCPFLQPPLTMVRQPAAELGAAAAKAVLKRVRHPDSHRAERVLLPTQLIVRKSTTALR
jgi:LacI family transcriptional regulator